MRHGTGKSTHTPIKQDAPRFNPRAKGKPGAYAQSKDAAAYVARCRQRELDKMHRRLARFPALAQLDKPTPILSVSDWNAAPLDAPFTCSGEAYRSNGLGVVVDWPKPRPQAETLPIPTGTLLARGAQQAIARAA